MEERILDKTLIPEFLHLQQTYPLGNFQVCSATLEGWIISGEVEFNATYNGKPINDQYSVEIHVGAKYPNLVPHVKEIKNKISKDFHTNPDGDLCLGASLEVKRKFLEEPNLTGFVQNCLIPFMYSYSYLNKYGILPYGELTHGGKGLLEYYSDLFGVSNFQNAFSLFLLFLPKRYRGHLPCPCGGGKKLRNCHGTQIRDLLKLIDIAMILNDGVQMAGYLKNRKEPRS